MQKYTVQSIALATAVMLLGAKIRGYIAIGPEVFILLFPLICTAIQIEQQRERVWRDYAVWRAERKVDERRLKGEIRIKTYRKIA